MSATLTLNPHAITTTQRLAPRAGETTCYCRDRGEDSAVSFLGPHRE